MVRTRMPSTRVTLRVIWERRSRTAWLCMARDTIIRLGLAGPGMATRAVGALGGVRVGRHGMTGVLHSDLVGVGTGIGAAIRGGVAGIIMGWWRLPTRIHLAPHEVFIRER